MNNKRDNNNEFYGELEIMYPKPDWYQSLIMDNDWFIKLDKNEYN